MKACPKYWVTHDSLVILLLIRPELAPWKGWRQGMGMRVKEEASEASPTARLLERTVCTFHR